MEILENIFGKRNRHKTSKTTEENNPRLSSYLATQQSNQHRAILLMEKLFPNLLFPDLSSRSNEDLLALHDILIEVNRLRHKLGKLHPGDPLIYDQLIQIANEQQQRVRRTLQ